MARRNFGYDGGAAAVAVVNVITMVARKVDKPGGTLPVGSDYYEADLPSGDKIVVCPAIPDPKLGSFPADSVELRRHCGVTGARLGMVILPPAPVGAGFSRGSAPEEGEGEEPPIWQGSGWIFDASAKRTARLSRTGEGITL